MSQDPRTAATTSATLAASFGAADEQFAGYGVMALPFSTGYVLALRCWAATTIGPPYAAVFVRSPEGTWVIQSDAPPERSCPRYFSAAAAEVPAPRPIEVTWNDPRTLSVEVEDALEWRLTLGDTLAARVLRGSARALPERSWRNVRVLSLLGAMAGPMLGVGRVRLHGSAPNGQWFRAAPKQLWPVVSSTARWRGQDLGTPAPLPQQARLADFWLPQRGVFYAGTAVFEQLAPDRHLGPEGSPSSVRDR